MKYEKTQKGNPHNLTLIQHTFPAKSIQRFVGDNNRVEVCLVIQNKQIRLKPNDKLFCARRIWDQRAEEGFMKKIEAEFQNLAERIINGEISKIDDNYKNIVNDFFALWNIRVHNKNLSIKDQSIEGIIDLTRRYSVDEQEYLEKHGITAIRPDMTITGRHFTGINIQKNILLVRKQLQDAEWGILKAKEGEFIVSDNFNNARIVPLTPTICLFSQSKNDLISLEEVKSINKLAIETSKEYYFAKNISSCPV